MPNLAVFNSFSAITGSTRLFRTIGLSLNSVSAPTLTFWMFHDRVYTSNDRVQPQVSVDGGSTWNDVGSAIPRYDLTIPDISWAQHTVDLSAYAGQADVRIGFLGISAYGNDCHIDDIEVTGNPIALVPTMTEWGMIIFIAIAGLGSVNYLRRQKRANN